jgi:hypothetical protein
MVRDWFYPSQATIDPYSAPPSDMRQTAVQHVQMWSFKDPKLPHAVIATANLTEAMLHDTLDRRRLISDWALRSIYAMAFCRFVNGLVDRDIAKAALTANAARKVDASGSERTTGNKEGAGATSTTSRGETSMYAHAAAIGLPEQFVDLRHQATHDNMPGLEVLRQAARRALEWLWERWWKVHATDDPSRALREREEQRLLGERNREARRVSALQEGVEAADRYGDHRLGASSKQQRTNETPGDVGGDGITHGEQDGKGSQHIYNAGVDSQRIIDGRSSKRPEKLAKTKLKHRPQSAFGLFEA